MGVMSKLMFWKKDEDIDFESDFGKKGLPDFGSPPDINKDLSLPPMESSLPHDDLALPKVEYTDPAMARHDEPQRAMPLQPVQQPSQQPYSQSSFQPAQQQAFPHHEMAEKNMEIVSAKLDMLKVSIEGISQKLDSIMRMASHDRDDTEMFRRKNW